MLYNYSSKNQYHLVAVAIQEFDAWEILCMLRSGVCF